jgi:hypothetical protein
MLNIKIFPYAKFLPEIAPYQEVPPVVVKNVKISVALADVVNTGTDAPAHLIVLLLQFIVLLPELSWLTISVKECDLPETKPNVDSVIATLVPVRVIVCTFPSDTTIVVGDAVLPIAKTVSL